MATVISSVIFDLDGTLTKTPSPWRHVHERLGVWESKACGYLDEWLSGGMTYVAAKIQEQCRWSPLLIYANELVDGPLVRINVSGDVSSPISKKALADRALAMVGSTMADSLVVSDTTRDLEQLCDCGHKLHVIEEDDLLRVNEFL